MQILQWIIPAVLVFVLTAFWAAPVSAAESEKQDRSAVAAANKSKWQVKDNLAVQDGEFAAIKDNLIFGEILNGGSLNDKQKALVTLVGLTTNQSWDAFDQWLPGILAAGFAEPLEIREALYQIAPYVGFPRVEVALSKVNAALQARGIALPLAPQGTVNEANRFAKGLETQKGIFGERISQMHTNAPAGQREVVVNYLSAYCFGDFYTRKVLDLKMREMVVFAAIASLGGCDPQVQGHATGNIQVGNSKQNLVDILAVLLPINGFPRTLNALAAVNAAAPEKNSN